MSARLALVALGALAALPAASATAQVVPCELHVWGAAKVFPAGSKWVAVGAPAGSYHADRSNPIANINALDPIVRLKGVPDAAFDGYFGAGVPVTVIRHEPALDLAAAKKVRAPLSARSASCSGDVIVSNLVDIEWPGGVPDVGLVGLIMAPAGMNMQVSFTRFDGAGRIVFTKRDGVNGRMAVKRAQWAFDKEVTAKALDDAVADGLRAFAREHLGIVD